MMKNKPHLPHSIFAASIILLSFVCLLFYGSAAQAANAGQDNPQIQRPAPPIAPQPPKRPSMNKSDAKETTPPKQETIQQKIPAKRVDQPPREAAEPPKSGTANKAAEDGSDSAKWTTPASDQSAQGNPKTALPKDAGGSADKTASNAKAPPPSSEDKSKEGSSGWVKNFFYTLLILCAAGSLVYCYRLNNAKRPDKPNKNPAPANTVRMPENALTPQAKIKNSSLLEQLIQFDMETYGQLRPGLDYEQPYYVEQLIKKYGGGDQAKIKRAIHLFYMNRGKT